MKKWWQWFLLSAVWIVAAILNIIDRRNGLVVGFDFLAAGLPVGLAICQYFCEKNGKTKILKYIYAGAIGLLLLYLAIVLLLK